MLRKFVFVLLVVTYLFAYSIFFGKDTYAAEIIQPFGGLTWEDGLFEVLSKVNNFRDIEKIDLLIGQDRDDSIDVRGIKTESALIAKLSELIEKHQPILMNPSDHRVKDNPMIETFTDINAKERKFIYKTYSIIASPIIISGIPFEMTVNFDCSPGYAILYPNKLLIEKRAGYTFPLVVKETKLYSKSPLVYQKYKEINQILDKKYSVGYHGPLYWEDSFADIWDDEDGHIKVTCQQYDGLCRTYTIWYWKENKKFQDAYSRHLADLESAKSSGKKDMGGGL